VHQHRQASGTWELTAPPGCRLPSPQVQDWLERGDDTRRPDQVAASCLLGLWNAGWTWEQAEQAVWDSPGLRHETRKAKRGRAWIGRVRRWAERVGDDGPHGQRAHGERADIAAARARVLARQWPKLAGHQVSTRSVTNVLLAVLDLADTAGRTQALHLSVRDVAERAGCGVATAHAALRYLQVGPAGARVLYREQAARWNGGDARAACYELDLTHRALPDDAPDVEHAGVQVGVARLQSHDAWRHGGLGPSALAVWLVLQEHDGLPVADVAALAGRRVNWTGRLLRRLSLHGLAVRRGDTWTRCTLADAPRRLDVAARHVGTVGRAEAQRQRHQAEREAHSAKHRQWLRRSAAERQAERIGLLGPIQDLVTGRWVDAATGEMLPTPQPAAVPPIPEPVGDVLREAAVLVGVTVNGQPVDLGDGDTFTLDYTRPPFRAGPVSERGEVRLTLQMPAGWLEQDRARLQAEAERRTATGGVT
jgi:hypothetical protein